MELSFDEILKKHNDILYKVSKSYAYPDHQDLYQEISIQLWRSLPNFKGESKITTWIYRIALNTAITYKSRKQKLDYRVEQKVTLDHDDKSEQLDELYRAINQLKSSYKSLIILQLEGYDYEEMSQVLGISKTLIGVKLSRAKSKLKSLIKTN